jgi:lipopolysaccharide cholinephosphotransferase
MLLQIGTAPENYGSFMNLVGRVLLKLIGGKNTEERKKFFQSKILKYESQHTDNRFLIIGSIKYMKYVYTEDIFSSYKLMKFVDDEFPVPVGYRDFLGNTYGKSYMELPPKKEQGIKLNNIVKIDTKKSYKEYKGLLYCTNHNHPVGGKFS